MHEYFTPDPTEDIAFAATTPDGRLAAAIDTPSGVVPAPPAGRSPLAANHVYGGVATTASERSEYQIDRDTTRPGSVEYDDPFNPSVTPFKRSFAYDRIDPELALGVAEPRRQRIPIGGTAVDGEDQFFADMVVDLVAGGAVRVPTVGPGARALAVQTFPPTSVSLHRDGADNWFVSSEVRRRVRLTMQLGIPRAVFGSPFAEIPFGELPRPAPLPPAAAAAADRVLKRIGVSRALRPREALTAMVTYFRGFAPSAELPQAKDPAGLYEELALSRKGVCRHRAYAFMVTAHHLGLPTRLVRNEAHAWVEVHDTVRWHRIDLGGAAEHLELDPNATGFPHVPPDDPRPWPEGAESSAEVALRSRAEVAVRRLDAAGTFPPSSPGPAEPGAAASSPSSPGREPATLTLAVATNTVRRGAPLPVSGLLQQDGRPCGGARIDLSLHSPAATPLPLGSLATWPDGSYAGAVTVRLDLEAGDYEVVATTPGTTRCGPTSAR